MGGFTPVPRMGGSKQGTGLVPGRRPTDIDFGQFGKHADDMRAGYLGGGYTPLFTDVANVGLGGNAGGNAGGAGGAGGGSTNSAETSPFLQEQIDRYRQRFSVDNTNRAIDKSNLGIMDAAALGAADAKAGQSRRGVLNTEASAASNQRNVFEPAQRAAANAAADISMQRERDLDALVLGGTSLMRAPDEVNLSNRGLNLQQMGMDRDDQRYRSEVEREERRRREDAARWQAMLDGLGEY